MDIQLFAGDKQIIAPFFEFGTKTYNNTNILILFIKNFSEEQQDKLFSIVNNLNQKNLYINAEYIALTTEKEIYFFGLDNYKDNKFENAIVSGYYDLMFAFVDQNDIIINKEYRAIKLNGLQFKKL